MKTTRWLGLLAIAMLHTGCIQYVSGYKKSAPALAAEATEPPAPEETGTDEGTEGGDEATAEGEQSPEEGVEETPVELVNACASCHRTGGTAQSVVLNKAAIPRLNSAYFGRGKTIHQAFGYTFTGRGRVRLEATLNRQP